MKRERVIELWLAGFALIAGLIVVVVLLGTAAADGPPMSEHADLSFSHIHNLLPTDTVYAFGHLSVVGNIIKKKKVDPLCNEQDGCYPYADGCEERDYYCAGNGTGCNYTSSNRHTDSWVDTGITRWVDVNECQEKEQKEQEYRDYECYAGSCNYSINDTKWIDTGIYKTTCIGVSLAPLEIISFAPLSYVDDTVGNWRAFNVTVNQVANVTWYLNDTLVLTNGSVREAKCTLHVDVVGEHNVTAIASNANTSDMQTWIWHVTELPKECEGTDTSCGCYPNCENCNEKDGCYPYGDGCEERDFYCAGNERGCNYTFSNRHTDSWVDTCNTRWVDVNECQEKEQKEQEYRDYECSAGSCNYSINDTKWIDTGIYNSTCIGVSLAPLEITSFAPLSYVDDTVGNWRAFNVTVSQAVNVTWYLDDTLVLTNGSVREAKCRLHAEVVGEHNVTAIASNANGSSDMQTWIWAVTSETPTIGTGTKMLTQTINVSNSFPMFSNAEYVHFTIGNDNITLTLDDNASFDGVCNLSDLMGRDVSVAGTTVELDYFPITYQGVSHDQKWVSAPFFDATEHKLYLLYGSGEITTLDLQINEVSPTAIPKVVGVGDLVGEFDIQTAAEGINSTGNHLFSAIAGVGFADLYVQYAPDTAYENITFIPTFSQCEQLQLFTDSIGSVIVYEAHMLGVAEGTEPVPAVSPDWKVSLELDVEYFPITYQNHSYDQKWEVYPFFDDAEHKLYLLAGTGIITKSRLMIEENSATTPIPKVVGVGSTVGQFQIVTVAEGSNSNYNWLESDIKGVGYANIYAQYAPDTSYESTPFLSTFSQCERLQVSTYSIISGSESTVAYQVDVLGVANGAEPIPLVSHDWNLSLELDVEYFPMTYQNISHDQKWAVYPFFDDTEHKLYLLAGTGIITKSRLMIEENSATTPIPKVVGVGSTVGQFQIVTVAEGSNSNYNWLESDIKGVGYANIYAQYAPDTSYESTPFLSTFSQCERLQVSTYSIISGSESTVAYQVDVLGVANGAEPIPLVSHDWNLSLELDVEYFPMTYQNISHDQKWAVYPFFDDTEHKLYLLAGTGIITKSRLMIEENSATTPIPKVVGVGSTVGQFQIVTVAEGSNSNYNWLESDIKGVGYANIYAQYAPDTSYEDITFIPTFSQCEQLQLNTRSNGSVVTSAADMLGVSTGSECLMFNGIPLDMVTIDETFDLTYHPVIISGDGFDEKWSVEPEQYEDTLVILRGTGAMTALNFIFNDSTAAHPEISSYGYLRGDYTITANILPHYMAVVANGPDVAAMDESGQGGFGVNFSGEPSPCFIATAAYGTPLHDDINVLRKFRDEYMMPNPAGQALVKIYYTTSPPIADLIRANEGLRTTARDGFVKPLVEVTRLFVE